MNFLAHLYLSGNQPGLIIGNFIADMVKGRQINGYPASVAGGIRLHRQIDRFTDSHPVVNRSKGRLRATCRHYAGVVTDMYYDHFLALNWDHYSCHSLESYVEWAYGLLQQHLDMLPERARYVLPRMVENNWLVNYADLDRLSLNFGGMARRTPYESGMEGAVVDLKTHYRLFAEEFGSFFPELMEFVEEQGVSLDHHRGLSDNNGWAQ